MLSSFSAFFLQSNFMNILQVVCVHKLHLVLDNLNDWTVSQGMRALTKVIKRRILQRGAWTRKRTSSWWITARVKNISLLIDIINLGLSYKSILSAASRDTSLFRYARCLCIQFDCNLSIGALNESVCYHTFHPKTSAENWSCTFLSDLHTRSHIPTHDCTSGNLEELQHGTGFL